MEIKAAVLLLNCHGNQRYHCMLKCFYEFISFSFCIASYLYNSERNNERSQKEYPCWLRVFSFVVVGWTYLYDNLKRTLSNFIRVKHCVYEKLGNLDNFTENFILSEIYIVCQCIEAAANDAS